MFNRKIPELNPENFSSDKQRELYAYWLKIKGNRLMPSRADMDPMDIPHLLSSIWMADVVAGDEIKLKVRLFGTDLVNAFNLDGTSQILDNVSFTGDIIKRLTTLVNSRKGYYCKVDFPVESEDFRYYSTLSLPMSSDNETVDIILSLLDLIP